ncbi:hypothetical protein BKA93DRAFT_757759 [Sparassis latifolia]|uniref:Ribonuclease III n=1 Tax=Sparassis crispa TaxID=139825 RepID=A0A401G6G6_9APHY|nr:ribonuclease III [Sparassis crispa]GBE77744.1 ribonuclease III [Sparassis crispa]
MVKAQVKGLSMQSEGSWSTPASDGTWPSSTAGSSVVPYSHTGSPSPGLKRSYSVSNAMDPHLTPAPKLRGDIILEVFTHQSLRFPGAPSNEEYGDNVRLSLLGDKILETAVTFTLFSKRPMLTSDDIVRRRDEILSLENIQNWIVGYGFREKVRCTPDALATLDTPKEARLLFSSYVGAVYIQNGMETVQSWIGRLVDPDYENPAIGADEPYAYKRAKTEPMGSPPPNPSMQPPPPMNPPPPLPMNPLAPAQPTAAFLPLFNQTANQRRLTVEYPAQFSGPAHAGRWTVQCIVNGIEKGQGNGPSKQLAKEEAARQAYYAMGWAPRA